MAPSIFHETWTRPSLMSMVFRGKDLVFRYETILEDERTWNTEKLKFIELAAEELSEHYLNRESRVTAFAPQIKIRDHRAKILIDRLSARPAFISQDKPFVDMHFCYCYPDYLELNPSLMLRQYIGKTEWILWFESYGITLAIVDWDDEVGIDDIIDRFLNLERCEIELAMLSPESAILRQNEIMQLKTEGNLY